MAERLRCREFVGFLADYLDGSLPPEQIRAFDDHLSRCPSCVTYAQTYAESLRLGRGVLDATEDAVPADVPDELVRAILCARSAPP